MPLDRSLLAQAKTAEARLIEAEHHAEALRTEFHRSIRRLQLAGGSLREIAHEFGLSHQRVHQIVEASGGGRSWRGGHAGAGALLCSFCGQHQKLVKHLIAGPDAYICDGCVERVHTVLARPATTASTPAATIRRVAEADRGVWCSFCGKSSHLVEAMAAAGEARICIECLSLSDEIIAENLA